MAAPNDPLQEKRQKYSSAVTNDCSVGSSIFQIEFLVEHCEGQADVACSRVIVQCRKAEGVALQRL